MQPQNKISLIYASFPLSLALLHQVGRPPFTTQRVVIQHKGALFNVGEAAVQENFQHLKPVIFTNQGSTKNPSLNHNKT